MNHLIKQINVLELRKLAKESNTGSFLHTSASTNTILILGFLQSEYVGGNAGWITTQQVAEFMNQTRANVLRLLNNLAEAGIVKKCSLSFVDGEPTRGTTWGWKAKP